MLRRFNTHRVEENFFEQRDERINITKANRRATKNRTMWRTMIPYILKLHGTFRESINYFREFGNKTIHLNNKMLF